MLIPLNLLTTQKEKEIRIFLRKEKTYAGVLQGFDEHGNLFMTDTKEITDEGCVVNIGSVIINGGTVAMIEVE